MRTVITDPILSKAIAALSKKAIFTARDASEMGIPIWRLRELVKTGVVFRAGRGLYFGKAYQWNGPMDIEFATACCFFPKPCYVGGLSALFHYNLSTAPPKQTWVIVPRNIKTIQKKYRVIRTSLSLSKGIEVHKNYRIASVERAVLDAMYFSYIFGKTTALYAAREAITSELTTIQKLSKLAKELRVTATLDKFRDFISLEALGLE